MVSVHDRLVMRANEAISVLCTDTTVFPGQTLCSLRKLCSKLNILIDTVEEDVRCWEGDDDADEQGN